MKFDPYDTRLPFTLCAVLAVVIATIAYFR